MKTAAEFLESYDIRTKDISDKERALFHLLKANEKYISTLIEEDETCQLLHKSLRQLDICENYHIDLALWFLLQDAPIFWKMVNDFTSGEFSEICPICKNKTFSIKQQMCITNKCFCNS